MSQSPSLLSLPVTFPLPSSNSSSGVAPGNCLWSICCFKPLTFRLCSRDGFHSTLIPFPFRDGCYILVLKQLHIKLEGGLKSRSSLTSTIVSPCTQPLPSCKFEAILCCFVELMSLPLLFPLMRGWEQSHNRWQKA